nr:phosphotransferase [Pseudaminobacter soli]
MSSSEDLRVASTVRTILSLPDSVDLLLTRRTDAVSGAGRRFFRSEAKGTAFHVKVGGVLRDPLTDTLARRLSELKCASVRFPKLYGRLDDIEVWEYLDGEAKSLHKYSPAELKALMMAVAEIEAAASDVELPATYWMKPVGPALRRTSNAWPELAAWTSQIKHLTRWDPEIIGRSIGACLTHNDLHSNNILVRRGGFSIIDWESASLGAPGGSLRVFASGPVQRRRQIITWYLQGRKRFGLKANPGDVEFSMNAHQGYWALHMGGRQKRIDLIHRGWEIVRRLKSASSESQQPR